MDRKLNTNFDWCDCKSTEMKAIEKYGADNQIQMWFEESAELSDAICKFKRGRVDKNKVCEEIADCYIVLNQLSRMFDVGRVDEWVIYKKKRLDERIEND